MPNNIILDGTLAYGATAITIDSQAYVVISFSPSRPVNHMVQNGGTGLPNASKTTAQQATFSAELQLESGSTPFPQYGDEFTYTCDANYGSENWIVHECVPKIEQDAIRTITVSGVKRINGSITVS